MCWVGGKVGYVVVLFCDEGVVELDSYVIGVNIRGCKGVCFVFFLVNFDGILIVCCGVVDGEGVV